MTAGHDDANSHDDHDDHGHGHDDHDAHGHGHDDHDAHGHDDHGSGGDAWVLIPLGVGLVIGLIIAVYFGLGSGVPAL